MMLLYTVNWCSSLSIFHSYCVVDKCMGKTIFPLQLKPFYNHAVKTACPLVRAVLKNKPMAQQRRTSLWLCSPPYPAKMGASSSHLRFLLFSDEDPSSLTPRSDVEVPQQQDWTSCSDQLADSVIPCRYPVRSKKALLEEQISAQCCCKCCAIIVRRAGIRKWCCPATLPLAPRPSLVCQRG